MVRDTVAALVNRTTCWERTQAPPPLLRRQQLALRTTRKSGAGATTHIVY